MALPLFMVSESFWCIHTLQPCAEFPVSVELVNNSTFKYNNWFFCCRLDLLSVGWSSFYVTDHFLNAYIIDDY